MKKVTVLVEITVDEENIKGLYPNFSINWNTTDEFIEYLTDNMESSMVDINEKQEDHLKTWGFSSRIISRSEAKAMDDEMP